MATISSTSKNAIAITNIHFAAASKPEVETGLLGYVTATFNGALRVDGVALRRTINGRLALSFPARRDSMGNQHPFIAPIDDAARRDIETQVFSALGLIESAQ